MTIWGGAAACALAMCGAGPVVWAAYPPSEAEVETLCEEYATLAYEVALDRDRGVSPIDAIKLRSGTDDPMWLETVGVIVHTVYINAEVRPHDLAFAVKLVCLEDGGW